MTVPAPIESEAAERSKILVNSGAEPCGEKPGAQAVSDCQLEAIMTASPTPILGGMTAGYRGATRDVASPFARGNGERWIWGGRPRW